jgi:hypothetical protein
MGESYDDVEFNGITCEKDKWEKWGREIKPPGTRSALDNYLID